MKKELYIRYFDKESDEVPANSHYVGNLKFHLLTLMDVLNSYSINMMLWMKTHPQGKVDFVWLS
jgi:hypothetical protein